MNFYDDLEWGIYNHIPKCSTLVDRKFDFWALNFAPAGNLLWGKNNGNMKLYSDPVAWWTWPGPHFIYGQKKTDHWNHYFVTFKGKRAQRFVDSNLLPVKSMKNSIRRVYDTEAFKSEFEKLIDFINKGKHANAVHQLEGMLLFLKDQKKPAAFMDVHQKSIQALALKMDKQPHENWTIEKESKRMALSPVHFRRLFKQQIGTPPNQYVIQARLRKASVYLRTTQKTVKEVSNLVGYDDIYYFSKLFKQHYQLPPATYRKRYYLG